MTFSRFPVFLAADARDGPAVEQFFHAACGTGRPREEMGLASARTTIFAESGATTPRNLDSSLGCVARPLTAVQATLESGGRVTQVEARQD